MIAVLNSRAERRRPADRDVPAAAGREPGHAGGRRRDGVDGRPAGDLDGFRPGLRHTFETWASAASESAAPPLSTVTSINCWEMVLLAAYRANLLTWQWIHDQYTAAVGDWGAHMVSMLSAARGSRTSEAAAGRKPLAGDLVFMDGMAHVALATGTSTAPARRHHLVLAAAEHAVHARRDDRQRQAHDDRGARRLVGGEPAAGAARRARRAAVVVAEIRATLPAEARTESVPQGSLLGPEPARCGSRRGAPAPGRRGPRAPGTAGITLHRLDGGTEQAGCRAPDRRAAAADGTWLLDGGSLRHGPRESVDGAGWERLLADADARTRSRGGRRRWSRAWTRRVGHASSVRRTSTR